MRSFALAVLGATALSCGDGGEFGGPVTVDLAASRPLERLSEYRLLAWRDGRFVYNERVVPYELATPLFSDYSLKDRAIYVPEGATITYVEDDVLDFPVGTVIVKSFSYAPDLRTPEEGRRPIETRVLVRHADGWRTWPYLWDESGRDATFTPAGAVLAIDFVDPSGEPRSASYLVPQRNQCTSCHERQVAPGSMETFVTPIGPRARHLDRDFTIGGVTRNPLEQLAEEGLLTGLPAERGEPTFDFRRLEAGELASLSAEELDRAARDYLDVNCAHCHNPSGVQGQTSQLFLNRENTDRFRLGVCKRPGSAGSGTGGLTYDLVPGSPEESILLFRMETEEVGAMMPLLGRSVRHDEGVELIRAWIASMPAETCD
jgi:uncharacterized repeat protein (TIGR03806 family)